MEWLSRCCEFGMWLALKVCGSRTSTTTAPLSRRAWACSGGMRLNSVMDWLLWDARKGVGFKRASLNGWRRYGYFSRWRCGRLNRRLRHGGVANIAGRVAFTAIALEGIKVEHCHRGAPDTARVQRIHARLVTFALQCRPVPENDLLATRLAVLVAEPGRIAGEGGVDAFLALEVKLAVAGAEAHAGEVVGDDPQPRNAVQILVPFGGFITVHAGEKRLIEVVIAQCGFNFGGMLQGFGQRPLRRYACMDHGDVDRKSVV